MLFFDFYSFIKGRYWLATALLLAVNATVVFGTNARAQEHENQGVTPFVAAAPLCTLDTIKNSQLFQSGGWPGLGPFVQDEQANVFSDAGHNILKLQVADDKVLQAELTLIKEKSAKLDPLDLRMISDFLLESLGTKPANIATFNKVLEKNEENILYKAEDKKVSLPVGRYLICFQRRSDVDNINLMISVVNQEANLSSLGESTLGSSNKNDTVSGTSKISSTNPKTGTNKVLAQQDMFLEVIKSWQRIKKDVVKTCQPARLSEILSGRALVKQTDAVKWLISNHKYYDMNPKLILVDNYVELVPGKKYAVYARVTENSKLVDQATGQVLKNITDTYKVNYTVEKTGDKWLITDSAVITPAPRAVHSQASRPNH